MADKLVWGPPDVDAAIAVLREAVALRREPHRYFRFYGPHVTNQIIRKALSSYPDDLVIVTKVSARRGGGWFVASGALARRTDHCDDNLRNLGLDVLDAGLTCAACSAFMEPALARGAADRAGRAPAEGLSAPYRA